LYEHMLSPSNATLPEKDEHETFLASACFNASEGNSSDDGGACTYQQRRRMPRHRRQ